MFLITTVFQYSRSKRNPDKPGKVYLRISRRGIGRDGGAIKDARTVSTNVMVPNRSAVGEVMDELRPYVMVLCRIVERLSEKRKEVSPDDVVADFRKCVAGKKSMGTIIGRLRHDFTVRADLVSLGNDLRRHFRFVRRAGSDSGDFFSYIELRSQQHMDRGQDSAARSCSSVKNSLSRFVMSDRLPFGDIDREFVVRYSGWLEEGGLSESTQSFYLRTFRALLNHAAEDGLVAMTGRLFRGLNTRIVFKRDVEPQAVLSKETLRKIAAADFSEDREVEVVRDMFMFGFYCRGMELMEILTLRKSDIRDGMLRYRRRLKGNERVVPLDGAAYGILRKYLSSGRPYIFPLLEKYTGLQHYAIADKVRSGIKHIGKAVGFPSLTFTMNISSWQSLMSQINASDILFGT